MTSEPVLVEKEDGVALVQLNRPDAGNACNAELATALIDLWKVLAKDDDVHVVVLIGAGTRHFCTGADVKRASQSDNAGFDHWPDIPEDFFKPVICAVNGVVAGGGWHFMWQADFAIASENASFLEPHVSIGWVPLREMLGMAVRVPQGPIRRMAYMGTAERMDADRALTLGIVTEVVPAAELRDHAMKIAKTIAKQAPLAVRLQKEAFQRAFDLRYAWRELYDHMHEKRIRVDWESEDGREGPRAFAEKRAPVWKGR
ncbi:enoyl-CoA hydratase/isomerase family protein [Oceanibacterium hippocampi]|uniref:Carnitinyl-CoA dehydratase n=1 Tax=Oceanibacterium hippocampi TaxID=745714 RepID=A0A1Y5TXE7_9PROT|nr:enoyl-CoA hydratase-related protein [Oceanibacterium hippocampi]SLN75738.1 Carnitinyl-CoA dehydratase [Oceanibacterium hippocampi]